MGCLARTTAVLTLTISACASSSAPADVSSPPAATAVSADGVAPAEQQFPEVVSATATAAAGGWTFDVTILSPYDSPARYADAWRVLGPDGTSFGVRELAHDHATEQPFTRTLNGVAIPDAVDVVTIEGRDLINGWGGQTLDVRLR